VSARATWGRRILRWTGRGLVGLAAAVAVLAVTVAVLERRTYDVPTPAVVASHDPVVIARGRYLATGPAHCVVCHGDPARDADVAAGRDVPLSGGREFKLPVGVFRAANLTADPETGVGAATDGQLARVLRNGVRRDGRPLVPIMPRFADLSVDDLTALVSFLRTLPPVRNGVVVHQPNALGHVVLATAFKPGGPSRPVVAAVAPAPTPEYGRYLVHDVAGCVGCHTQRSLRTGAFTGPLLAGGFRLTEPSGITYVTPNLTPAPNTGRITNWNEETFVARIKMGRGADGSPMPWPAFGRMSEADLRAIYRYLRTVPAVENDTGPSVIGAPAAPAVAEATPSPSR
jgi:mono/diheme cytochrome c family protein